MGTNFPVAEYLRPHILDARTISRTGAWWTAILVIEDPRNNKPYIALYKWQSKDGSWRKSTSFRISQGKHLTGIVETLAEFSEHLS